MRRSTSVRLARTLTLVPAAVLCAGVLTACSFSANLTVPASTIAADAERALADIGEADVDCGDESVGLVNGEVVECELTDPATGTLYDLTVTLSEVDGTEYHVDVKVADEPKA